MSTFDDASLVFIPSGYKTSKAYSVKPSDGSGDLTFSRSNDTATRVNSAGLIEKVRTNVLTYSQDFSNANWVGFDVTRTGGQTDPNGGTTASLYTSQTSSANVTANFSTASSSPYTLSIYIKGTSSGSVSLRVDSPSLAPSNIINYTTSWQRFTYTFTAGASTSTIVLGGYASFTSSEGIYLAFAQAELGDIATSYIATTSAAVSVGPVANVPRLDYLNSSCPRLLLEPQRTNSLTYSEQFDNAAWTKSNATVTANTSVSPDGYTNADTVVITSGGYLYREITSYSAVSGQSAVISVFAKNQTANFLIFGGATAAGTDVYKIENYGNGWYRHSVVRTFTTTATTLLQYLIATNMVGTHIIWGAQIEGSNSAYATSYIPTLGAAVTRGADDASKTSASALIGQTEGTLFCDVEWTVKPESGSPIISLVSLNNTTNLQNCIVLGIERAAGGSNRFYSFVQVSNSTTAALIGSNITNGRYKAAFAYKENDFVLYVNGVQIATDTSGAVPTNSQVIVGGRFVGDSYQVSDPISQALVFKTRLSNADLAALTA